MKPFTLILLLAFSTMLFAQNDTLIVNNDYKWKVGVKGFLEEKNSNGSDHYNFNSYFINYGIQGFYKISETKEWHIEIGIYYVRRLSEIFLITQNRINSYNIIYNNNKLYIPLKFNNTIRINRNYRFGYSIGSYVEYLLSNNFKPPQDAISSSLFDRKYVFGLSAELGIEREINKNLSIIFNLGFNENYTSTKTYEDTFEFSNHPASYNYFIGISIIKKLLKK